MRRNRVDDDGDENIDENERGQHDVAQEKCDGHRRVRSAADHVRCCALPQESGRRNDSTARKSMLSIGRQG